MLEIFNLLTEQFSESYLSEFAHDKDSIGYNNVLAYLQNYESDFTDADLELIRQVVKRDCEIYGW